MSLQFLLALSGLVNAFCAGTLGLVVFGKNPRSVLHQVYGSFCLSLFVWGISYFFWLESDDAASALFWSKVLIGAALFIPPTAFHHLVKLIDQKIPRWFIAANYLLAGVFSIANLGPWVVLGVESKNVFPFWPKPGVFFYFHQLQFASLALLGLWFLTKEWKHAEGLRLNQLKFLLLAEVVGWGGGSTNYLLWYDIQVPPYGTVLISVYTGIFAYAMVRYRLLDIEIVLKKSVIYAVLLLGLLLPCYLIVIWGQTLAFGTVNYKFSLATLLLFITVGFFFPKLRFKTEDALERVLFKKRFNYRETLLRSSKDMVSIIDIKALSDSLVRTIGKSLGIEKVSLLLNNESKANYHLEAAVGLDLDNLDSVQLAKDGPLVQLLQRRREPIVKEELEWVPVGPETPHTVETMSKLGAEISLPIVSKEKLIGILNLGHKEDKTIYSNEDLELLSTLTNQAAIAIENARLYENLKQSQDTLRRADRLSSLGLLTAGLAHEIRNPLVAIRTFTQLLPERYDDAEFREGFQGLALKEVDRICGLINDLLSFARPSKPNVSPENLNDVVDNIARILETQAKEKGVAIAREFGDDLPKVWIDREQMKQVFMNLILNAIQAMQEGGSINISTRAVSRNSAEPSGEFVQVEVRDSGIGIPEENVQHIFDPFFTSKDEGSGLGLAVSHQIVQEHGGFVTVESTVGKGTAFFVHVPVGKPMRPAAPNGRAQVNEANLNH